MAGNVYIPICRVTPVTNLGQRLDFGAAWCGAVCLLNIGADDCWIAVGADPVAADVDGQLRLPAGGPGLQFDRIKFNFIGCITLAGETAMVQGAATPGEQG